MKSWTRLVLAGVCLAGPGSQACAQSPLILDRNRADRIQPVTPAVPQAEPENASAGAPTVEGGTEQNARIIKGISFVGTRAPESAARAAERFVGQPATRANLQNIAAAISSGYARSNVALYSVLIPNQDMADGVLRVVLIEGTVESVIVTDKSTGRARRLVAAIAQHLTGRRPLSRSALQRYVSLVQDVPGTKTDIDIVQGSARGLVRVVLTVRDKRNEFGAGFDNRAGVSYSGGEFSARATLFHLLRGGDQTDLNLGASANFHDYLYASLAHSTAIGSNGGRLTASFGYLKTRPRDSTINGNAKLAGLSYSYPLLRDYKHNLTASFGIDGLDSDNASFGQLITSERTRALRVALGYVVALPKRTISGGITISQGLDFAGARVTAPLAEAKFTKLNARAEIDQAIGKRFIVRFKTAGQYTRDRLPAAERFAVGGEDYGRAFDVAVISADRGIAGSFELAMKPVPASKLFGATELYGFVDGAKLKIFDRGPVLGGSYDLASTGGGVRLSYTPKAALFVEAAKPIDLPYPGYDRNWRISVGWKLALRA